VHIAPDLKYDLVDSHSCGPMVERALSFTHSHLSSIVSSCSPAIPGVPSHLVSADVDADVASNPLVQEVFLSTQPFLDRILSELELRSADSAVVIPHAQTPVAPDHRCAFR